MTIQGIIYVCDQCFFNGAGALDRALSGRERVLRIFKDQKDNTEALLVRSGGDLGVLSVSYGTACAGKSFFLGGDRDMVHMAPDIMWIRYL